MDTRRAFNAKMLGTLMAYGLVETAFALPGVQRAELDVDIGLEATGRTIPYEWVVVSHIGGEAQRALRAVKARQRARIEKRGSEALAVSNRPQIENASVK